MNNLIEQARIWCVGKQWWWRLLVLSWFMFELKVNLANPSTSIFHSLNLPIHELGHIIFGFTGQMFIGFLGGTIAQLAAPIYGMWNFYQQKDFFAIALCFGWLSTNLFDISVYMGDARSMALPLVSPSTGEPIHDWNWIFSRMGLLSFDFLFSAFVWILALFSMLLCFLIGGWLIWQMARTNVSSR